jgi:hypothetical protein
MPRWTALTAFGKRRVLTAAEYAWATDVFGPTLPPRERIGISPAVGLHRRPFTLPLPGRRTTMFLGRQAPDPVTTAPALFAHELTHVWQVSHARHVLPWLARAVVTQLRNSAGTNVYAVGEAVKPWDEYTIEQQATIVEHWVRDPDGLEGRRLRHYVDDEIRAAGRPAA